MSSKLDELIKEVNKRFKEDVVTIGLHEYKYERIPFTSATMNYCTFGGIPVGIVAEFYGEEHGGKTTTALDVVANFQRMFPDRKVLYCDCENTLDVEWARKLNVDVDSLIIMQPHAQSAEQIFQFIYECVETGEIGLVVIDSLGVMVSQQEFDKSIEDKTYAGISMSLTSFSKKIEMSAKKNRCTCIGINQIRQNINSAWGGIKTPGGQAWKHVCSLRMEFSRGKFTDERGNELTRSAETPAGNIVQVSLAKSKVCPPTRRVGRYRLNYEFGIDFIADLIDVAVKLDIVKKSGAWFEVVDIESGEVLANKIQGQANLQEFLEQNDEVTEHVSDLVYSRISL